LGDTVCAIPAFRALRKHFPSSRLILLTKREQLSGDLFSLASVIGNDIFNEVIYYTSRDLKDLLGICSFLRRIKKLKIDLMINLGQYDATLARLARDMLFFYFCGCRLLYGFTLRKNRIFRIAQRYYRKFDCEIERLLMVLQPLGISDKKIDYTLPLTKEDKFFIDNLWFQQQSLKDSPIVGIIPVAKFPVNRWPKENFVYLVKALMKDYGAFIVVMGGKDTQETASFIEKNVEGHILNLAGKTSVMQTAEAISRCDLSVSCDSGLVHLAAALKRPVVGIYTARDYPNCWYPYGNNHIVIRHDAECQVCLKAACKTMKCIKDIGVGEVLTACRQILNLNNDKIYAS
jgi:ADP-heptose:LPS heptosyltransferase